MGAKSRRKGKLGELQAAAEIRRLFGVEARRGRQFHGGDGSPDIVTAIVEGRQPETLTARRLSATALPAGWPIRGRGFSH